VADSRADWYRPACQFAQVFTGGTAPGPRAGMQAKSAGEGFAVHGRLKRVHILGALALV